MNYEIEINEQITGKARPRMNTYTGRAYTPTKTKNYEYLVRYTKEYKQKERSGNVIRRSKSNKETRLGQYRKNNK